LYCLLHADAAEEHTVLARYGVALDHTELQHLVLGDRLAQDAALAAAGYLAQRERRGREAFCLRSGGDATFQLAEEFGR
jgi:hypothetical protein